MITASILYRDENIKSYYRIPLGATKNTSQISLFTVYHLSSLLDRYFGTPPITFQNFHHFFKSNLYFRLKSVILRNLKKVMGGVQKYQSR